jgi:hypothetical protein
MRGQQNIKNWVNITQRLFYKTESFCPSEDKRMKNVLLGWVELAMSEGNSATVANEGSYGGCDKNATIISAKIFP